MLYISDDFTLDSYKKILELAKLKSFEFIGYDQVGTKTKKPVCLLRHDVDSELWGCLPMAKIEYSLGIKATYFLMCRSTSYNLFCIESINVVRDLIKYGHDVGLHFMGELYESDDNEKIAEKVLLEADIIQKEFDIKVNAVSFHQPSDRILNDNIEICGLVNTYNNNQMKDYYYFADTNMNWKSGLPSDIFSRKKLKKLQLLIHPMWWTKKQVTLKTKWRKVLRRNKKILIAHWKERERSLKEIEL